MVAISQIAGLALVRRGFKAKAAEAGPGSANPGYNKTNAVSAASAGSMVPIKFIN